MVAPFSQSYTKPDERALLTGRPVSAGTTGPYAPANADPASYRNQFVSQLKKNPPATNFYQQVYSAEDAARSQQHYDSLTDQPNFADKGDQQLAQDFLWKYMQGGQRGLMPIAEQVTPQTIASIQSQQPSQGIADGRVVAADRIKYPGASGTQTS